MMMHLLSEALGFWYGIYWNLTLMSLKATVCELQLRTWFPSTKHTHGLMGVWCPRLQLQYRFCSGMSLSPATVRKSSRLDGPCIAAL